LNSLVNMLVFSKNSKIWVFNNIIFLANFV
jgi:hypothetical protein